jgi:hypothetical protein
MVAEGPDSARGGRRHVSGSRPVGVRVPGAGFAAVVLSTTSFSFALWNVLSVTIRQRLVPGAVLGRVNAAARSR